METYFAKIENEKVVQVEVVTPEFVANNPERYNGLWKQVGTETQKFVGEGSVYLSKYDKIIDPKPFPSWIIDSKKEGWEAPLVKPGENYNWDEEQQRWILFADLK